MLIHTATTCAHRSQSAAAAAHSKALTRGVGSAFGIDGDLRIEPQRAAFWNPRNPPPVFLEPSGGRVAA